MRKLATIRKIDKLEPIPGADRIELAHVGGWKVVVAKDVGHLEGDYVVYCEVDSFLPIKPEFEFLRKTSYKKLVDGREGFRLKTIRLRGQISQGLIIPIRDVKHEFDFGPGSTSFFEKIEALEGQDVSEILGITKYEPPVPAQLAGTMKGNFPSFIPKTDEERIQNLSKEYETWKNKENKLNFYATEKLDGSSFTCYINDGEFGVCSRNIELEKNPDNTFWKVAIELNLEEKLRSIGSNIALQGELIGEGIQGNSYNIKGHTVKFFTAFNINTQERMGYDEFEELVVGFLRLEAVPVLAERFTLPNTIEHMLLLAEGKSKLLFAKEREGLVMRSRDNKISFKAISNNFLLKDKS